MPHDDKRDSTEHSFNTDVPLAWAVSQPKGAEFDYLIFPDRTDAEVAVAEDEENELQIVPLYARSHERTNAAPQSEGTQGQTSVAVSPALAPGRPAAGAAPSNERQDGAIARLEDFVQEGCSARPEDKHHALQDIEALRAAPSPCHVWCEMEECRRGCKIVWPPSNGQKNAAAERVRTFLRVFEQVRGTGPNEVIVFTGAATPLAADDLRAVLASAPSTTPQKPSFEDKTGYNAGALMKLQEELVGVVEMERLNKAPQWYRSVVNDLIKRIYQHRVSASSAMGEWKLIKRSLVAYPVRIQRHDDTPDVIWREREDGTVFAFTLPPLPPIPSACPDGTTEKL